MKKNSLTACSILLFACASLLGCKKESSTVNASQEDASTINSINSEDKSLCRLVLWHGLDDGYSRTLRYNDKGLLNFWHESSPLSGFDVHFIVAYEPDNKVSKIKYYDHDNFSYTIVPVYQGSRIIKELWYLANTHTLDDKIVNTYDANGRIVRRESLNYNYYSIFTYDAIGNVIHGGTYDNNGTVYDSVVQTFERPVREPMNAAPGMPYPIPFINYVISKLKYTYLKEVYEDANGNFVTSYKLDPDKSKLRAGPFHYAVYYKTFDIVSGVSNRQIWRYDNCNCDNDAEEAQLSSSPNSFLPGSNKGPMPFITIPQMKQRIIQLRRQQNK